MLQQALYDGIAGPVRAELHRQAARTLMGLDAPAERVARQLLAIATADAMEGWEVSWLADNAEELVRRIPAASAELLDRALRQARPDDSRRAGLEDHLLEALFVLGRYEKAEQLCRSVLPRASDPDRYGQVAWLMGYVLARLRSYGDAEAALAAASDRPGMSPVWQARVFALRAMVANYNGIRTQGTQYATAALAAGRELGDATATAYALHALAFQHFNDGDFRTACRLTDEALLVAERDPRLVDLWLMMAFNRANGAADLGDYELAWKLAQDALARGEPSGSWRLGRLHGVSADIAYETGRWDEALAELDASAHAIEVDDEAEAPYLRVLIAGHRDQQPQTDDGLASLKRSTNEFSPPDRDESPSKSAFISAIAVLHFERSGDPDRVASLLEQWLGPDHQDRLLPFLNRVLPSFVRLCLAAGGEARAHAVAEAATREADRDPLARKRATAQWCQGLIRADPARVLTAAGSLRGAGLPMYAGNAFEDAAVLLAQAGTAPRARTALGEALYLYGQLGAAWDARRAASRVRQWGIRSGVRGPRHRPQTGWEALTATERQVAGLVAAGYSNPVIAGQLFISRRTVESHVSSVLGKLQISSRWEVRTVAKQKGP